MVINETAQIILETTKAQMYAPSLITSWILFLSIMILVGWISNLNKKSWGNFWNIWWLTAIASGLVVLGFVMIPETISNLFNSIKEVLGINGT